VEQLGARIVGDWRGEEVVEVDEEEGG